MICKCSWFQYFYQRLTTAYNESRNKLHTKQQNIAQIQLGQMCFSILSSVLKKPPLQSSGL